MNEALLKSLTLLFLIIMGLLLKSKFGSKDQVNGIKELVLTIALPTTIFISLMKIEMDSSLLIVPVLTLAFNCLLFILTPLSFGLFHLDKESAAARTMTMLVPSLAPGLSCFPFIAEFLGQKSLAVAALADVGNKFFVLIILYLFALSMFLKNNKNAASTKVNRIEKMKQLLKSLVSEPINLFIAVALILLSLGFNYDLLPTVITSVFDKTSAMMTPLVLIYIGLAVQLKNSKRGMVVILLLFRAGITLLISGLAIFLGGITDTTTALLITVIPLSSVSFWPLAHISAFNLKEEGQQVSKEKRTFDMDLAILVLAFSLPFSTVLILTILTSGTYFTTTPVLIGTGICLLLAAFLPQLFTGGRFSLSKS